MPRNHWYTFVGIFINGHESWIPKYKDCLTPFGWLAIMHAYHTMIVCYVKMNDFENAKKYYDIIEKEAPNYPDLNTIKNFVDQKTIIDK